MVQRLSVLPVFQDEQPCDPGLNGEDFKKKMMEWKWVSIFQTIFRTVVAISLIIKDKVFEVLLGKNKWL